MFKDSNVLKFLPSKRFIIGFVVVFLIIAGALYIFKKPKAGLKYETSKLSGTSQSNINLSFSLKEANKDSDNDGLKDWEEMLWKTDPNNPDTDADGTPDGEEIRQNRDPLKAGPDDKLLEFKIENKGNDVVFDKNNLTNELSRRVVADYFSQKGQGLKPEVAAGQLVESLAAEQTLKDEFSKNDFQKFIEPIKENKKNYLNRLGIILKTNFQDIEETELQILERELKKEDGGGLNNLKPHLAAYLATVNDFKKISIPNDNDYLELHLLLINIMNNLSKSVEAMQLTSSDPLKMLLGLKWYLTEAARWKIFSGGFENLVLKDDIIFEDNEGGAFILNQ